MRCELSFFKHLWQATGECKCVHTRVYGESNWNNEWNWIIRAKVSRSASNFMILVGLFYDEIRYLKILLRLAWVWMSGILCKFSMTIRDRWHIWLRSNGCIFWEYEDGRLEVVFIARCRTGEAIHSVSAICPMLYWGSFFEMCDCEQCYIWGSVKQCQPEQRTAGLLYVY